MSDLLRSKEMAERYLAHRTSGMMAQGCVLCTSEPLHTFHHWKITPNNFPYDKLAKTHHMLVPLRHTTEDALSEEEMKELRLIKVNHTQQYDYILEAKKKSIPEHFHLHLIEVRKLDT